VLVELNVVEQRYQAVLDVLNDGASVTDVARRRGVARQTVHEWLRRYAADGLGGLADHSSKPLSCIRWPLRSKRGSWRCAARIRGGGHARSWCGSSGRACHRCRGVARWNVV
jgi:transposase-like protein